MIMEAARTVNKKFVQLTRIVTGDDKQLLTIIHTIEQTKHFNLRIVLLCLGESLFKFVKDNRYLLLNRSKKIADTGNSGVNNNDWHISLNRLFRDHTSKQRFTNALLTRKNDTEVSLTYGKRFQNLFCATSMIAIDCILVNSEVIVPSEPKTHL